MREKLLISGSRVLEQESGPPRCKRGESRYRVARAIDAVEKP